MTISQRVGISLIACALAGAWALPATAAELPASPAVHKVVRTAMVKKPRRHRPIRLVRHRPIRLVSAEWPLGARYRGGASYLVLGVGF
jgi:hypothetical protein